MKAYVLTTKNSTRLKDGKIENYPTCLPEPEIIYGPTLKDGIKAPDWFKCNPSSIEDTTWCCTLGKLKLLEYHNEHYSTEDCLIMEDDVYFSDSFNGLYNAFMSVVPDDWKMIFFGGKHLCIPVEVKTNVLRSIKIVNNECFLVKSSLVPVLIDLLKVENLPCNHASDCVIATIMKEYPTYSPIPFFAGQRSGYSYIRNKHRCLNINTNFTYLDKYGNIKQSSIDDYSRYIDINENDV